MRDVDSLMMKLPLTRRKAYAHPVTGELMSLEVISREFNLSPMAYLNKVRHGHHPSTPDTKNTYRRKCKAKAKQEMAELIAGIDARKAVIREKL